MQIRTHITSNTSAAISAAAVRLEDTSIVALWNGTLSARIMLAVDDEIVGEDTPEYVGARMAARRRNTPVGPMLELLFTDLPGFKVHLAYGGRSAVFVDIPESWRGRIRGLVGNANGNVFDDLMRPDGEILPVNSSIREIHEKFGLEWEVRRGESLFTEFNYVYAHAEEQFNRAFVPLFGPCWAENSALRVQAEKMCQGNMQCLYDASATGSLEYARLTLQDAKFGNAQFDEPVVDAGEFLWSR